eukprot:1194205-Alexandrium_andersonii.AAC.1
MSASLVGSEMCIRDSPRRGPGSAFSAGGRRGSASVPAAVWLGLVLQRSRSSHGRVPVPSSAGL